MPNHKVQEGESLITIAKKYRFLNWKTIYEDAGNAGLRSSRSAPNAILTGDTVVVPDKKSKKAKVATGKEHKVKLAVSRGIWNLKWAPDKVHCGDKPALEGETNLKAAKVKLKLTPRQGSAKLTVPESKVSGDKLEKLTLEVKDVALMKTPTEVFPAVELETTTDSSAIPSNVAVLKIEPLSEASAAEFSASRSWNGYTNNSHFRQKIEKFTCKVDVSFDVLKCWGGYWVDLTSAGVTGKAGDCPWVGHRWARSTGLNAMAPNQYYDGTSWVALPTGFVPSGTNYSAIAFYLSSTGLFGLFPTYTSASGGAWPGKFKDYDFASAKYTKKRNDWIKNTHDVWSDQFYIRRKGCKSAAGTRCCIYTVDVTMTFKVVTAYAASVIALCPGGMRSNTAIWFLDEPRLAVAAHEAGHHMDNPDEYTGGAVDASLSGDGAVNGIDSDCIMGQNLTKVKKRHYHAFAVMTKKLIKTKYGKDYDYEVVAKA